jgi:methylmalonyl-CoA mutase N-terminal domain/subunit
MTDDRKTALAAWEETVLAPQLAKNPERQPAFTTPSGLPVERVYTGAHLVGFEEERDLGLPGAFPFTRGVQPTLYRGRHWTMRQYAGFGGADETNQRFRYLLEKGQTGLSVAFDLPTQMGLDPDHALSVGEVGRVGVSIATLADMEALLAGLPLDKVSTSMTINSTAPILLAMYLVVAERQGVPAKALRGTVQNDVLKEYIARGTYIYPPAASMRLITDVFAFTAAEVPKWNPISISGYHLREAGSTAAEEIGLTLADAVAYVEAAVVAGLPIDKFAPNLSFFFSCHNNLLEEVAKFRAARRLWARLMKERFGAKDERSMMLRFHTQTSGVTLTAQQPENNVVRVAYQALAAVLGGTQSLHTNSWDEALALPSEKSALTALRTQQIAGYETGVADTIDPLAGSYLVEAWTDRLEAEARAILLKIDALGGAVAAIERRVPQRMIADSSYRYQLEVERGERVIVGVNKFQEKPKPIEVFRVDPETEARQRERLARVKAERDPLAASQALAGLTAAARGTANLMPFILAAVRAEASVGEISDALRDVFGTYHEGGDA